MELSRDFVPEARRLLTLARTDRRAAEAELGRLSPENQAVVVVESPLSIRRSLIELLPDPERVIPLLPEAELVYTCRSIGLADADWLLPMATPRQLVACFDLDAWKGIAIDPVRLDEWVAALAATDDETMLRGAQSIDPELIALYLRQHIDVHLKPSPQDDPDWSPPDGGQTLEGQFYFVAKDPKDDLAPLQTLLHSLFRGDYWHYFRMIQSVHEESNIENEEWALRWRTGRLEDLGFPPWDTSMRIYGFLREAKRGQLPDEDNVLDLSDASLPMWTSDLPGRHSKELPLFAATRELEAKERSALFYALISLSNRVAVADRMSLGDAEALPEAIDKATRYASIGLEFLARENGRPLPDVLRRTPLDHLFRVGVNVEPEGARPKPLSEDEPEPQDA